MCRAIDILEHVLNSREHRGQTAPNHKWISCCIELHILLMLWVYCIHQDDNRSVQNHTWEQALRVLWFLWGNKIVVEKAVLSTLFKHSRREYFGGTKLFWTKLLTENQVRTKSSSEFQNSVINHRPCLLEQGISFFTYFFNFNDMFRNYFFLRNVKWDVSYDVAVMCDGVIMCLNIFALAFSNVCGILKFT